MAQRRGKPIVRIFGQFMCSENDDEAIERFRADKHKEDTADCFQDAIHALYENADRESMSGWPNHNAHTETPHTRLVTTPIAKVMPTAAAVMSRLVTTRRLIL